MDQSVPPKGSQDDEEDEPVTQKASLSSAELYLQVCQQTGSAPVSSFLRQTGEATLNLNHCGLGPQRAKALAVVLQNDVTITNLELEDNALKAEGTSYLIKMLETNTTIQSLNLSNNQLHLEGAKVISVMLHDNKYVKSVKLSGNGFDDSAAKHIATALKDDSLLTELDLSHNMFCDVDGHLGHMLANNIGITILNLSQNRLCMAGARSLIDGLKMNSTLEELYLAWNGLGRVEAESLGQALKQNSKLELLDVSWNHMDDQAATLLSQGLATNSTLRVLKLSYNYLTHSGALALLRRVKDNRNSALEEIDISSVFVREEFVELLEEARQQRPALDVQYSVTSSVTRNLSALSVFQKFLDERNESIMDFFQALDKEGTMSVPNSAFREAVKAVNAPLDQHQVEWLIRKFDKSFTASITYSQFAELS